MAAITVRNLSEETHRALKARAAAHGRSTEAEVRAILNETVLPTSGPSGTGLGSQIARIFADLGGVELDIARDRTPSEPIDFS